MFDLTKENIRTGASYILVSLIIPIKNERENIRILLPLIVDEIEKIREVDEKAFRFEILIIDDYSSDKPNEIIANKTYMNKKNHTKNQYFKVILTRINAYYKKSVGRAIRKGLESSTGDYIITLDGDMAHDPENISRCINLIRNGKNLIIGARFLPKQHIFKPISRYIISKILNTVIRFFYRAEVHDYTTGFRCFNRKLLNNIDLKENGFAIHLELNKKLIEKTKKSERIEIPIEYKKRMYGKSKMVYTKVWFDYFKLIFDS